ncbi:MAG: hypothetical protein R3F21_21900 [Myxococcota bacterium]
MFFIASTGRCGTRALCDALAAASDHRVRHEPEPLLLAEARRAHRGRFRYTPTLLRRLFEWYRLDGTPYGESLRCPTLLGEIAGVARGARFVVLFRDPGGYLASAWGRGVLRKGNAWDRYRLLPDDAEGLPIADQILLHQAEVHGILADFAERRADRVLVCELRDLEARLPRICEYAGIGLRDPARARAILAARPNAGPVGRFAGEPAPTPSPAARARADRAYERLRKRAAAQM